MARAVYVYRPEHPAANHNGMVDTRDLDEEIAPLAVNAPVMTGRFYENNAIRVSENKYRDIGSRRKYRDYLRETGYTHASDYTQAWKKAAEQREAVRAGKVPSKTRREVLDRTFHKIRGY